MPTPGLYHVPVRYLEELTLFDFVSVVWLSLFIPLCFKRFDTQFVSLCFQVSSCLLNSQKQICCCYFKCSYVDLFYRPSVKVQLCFFFSCIFLWVKWNPLSMKYPCAQSHSSITGWNSVDANNDVASSKQHLRATF